jgi:hypothetical protein
MFILTQDAGSRNNTTSTIEEPNFAGRNITLTASGGIGSQLDGTVVITKGISSAEFASNAYADIRRAVADAEWDDVDFSHENEIWITRYDDIDIAASGWLKTESKSGATYLGSQNDVAINEIISGINGSTKGTQPLRFKMDGSMLPIYTDRTSIYALNAILEAAGGTIGTSAAPMVIQLTGGNAANGWITARGTEGVHLSFVQASGGAATAYVREFGSTEGDITLIAGAVTDALPMVQASKIAGRNIVLDITNSGIDMWVEQYIDGSLIVSVAGNATLISQRGSFNFARLAVNGDAAIWTKRGGIAFTDAEIAIAGNATFTSVRSVTLENSTANFVNGDFEAVDDIVFVNSTVHAAGNLNQYAGDEIFIMNSSVFAKGDMDSEAGYDFTAVAAEIEVNKNLRLTTLHDISIVSSSITAFEDFVATALGDISIVASDVWALDNMSLVSGNRINQVSADVVGIGGTNKVAVYGVYDVYRNMYMGPQPIGNALSLDSVMRMFNGMSQDTDEEEEQELIKGYWLPAGGEEIAIPVALMD